MDFNQSAFREALGRNLQQHRQRRGLTLEQTVEVADLSMSRSSLWAIEKGTQDISAIDLYALSVVLGVSMDELMNQTIESLLGARFSSLNLNR